MVTAEKKASINFRERRHFIRQNKPQTLAAKKFEEGLRAVKNIIEGRVPEKNARDFLNEL